MMTGELPLYAEAAQSDRTRRVSWKSLPLSRTQVLKSKGTNSPTSSGAFRSFLRPADPREQQSHHSAMPPSRTEPSQPMTINTNDVLKELTIHERFSMPWIAPGVEVTDLPSFDDVTSYGVTKEIQKELWLLEVQSLINDITQEEPLRFQGSKNLDVDSKESCSLLSVLADQLMQCLHISNHDTENLLAKYHETLCDRSELKNCKTLLEYLSERRGVSEDGKSNDGSESGDDLEDGSSKLPEDGGIETDLEDFFKFVDYCTSALARNLCSAVNGEHVQVNILAHMAKIRTKVKVLSADLRKYASISLAKAPVMGTKSDSSTDSQDAQRDDGDMDRFFKSIGLRPRGNETAPLERQSNKKELRIMYFEKCNTYQSTLTRMLGEITGHLRGTNGTQTFPTFFEICAVVYKTGFESLCTLVFQDEGNGFTGTSDSATVNYCHNAAHMLNQTLIHMFESGESTPSPVEYISPSGGPNDSSIGTTIFWEYTPGLDPKGATTHLSAGSATNMSLVSDPSRKRRFVEVKTMSNVITIIVPLLLMNATHGRFATQFFNLLSLKSFLSDASDSTSQSNYHQQERPFEAHIYGTYQAIFSLTTADYRNDQNSRRVSHSSPRSLSNAPMRRNNLHKGEQIGMLSRTDTQYPGGNISDSPVKTQWQPSTAGQVDEDTLHRRIEVHQQELIRYGAQMRSWVFEEKGVMVQCRAYVLAWCLVSTLIAGGGILCGVTVGGSITAVDPFNITTYAWVLAGFIILIVKSVMVHDWPWNDFLHGRVLCRSVSELSSVTGINEQLILAKLLHEESLSCMSARGPFNAVFRKKSPDGFSIDRPISMWTMLLSGLIMIEVESIEGRSLVCLDLRRGTVIEEIKSMVNYQTDKKCIHCRDLPTNEESVQEGSRNRNRLVLVPPRETQWVRVLGIYSNKNAMFV